MSLINHNLRWNLKGKMAENNNQNTVDKQQMEQLNSIPPEPVRDEVVFCHYSKTFVNTFPSF